MSEEIKKILAIVNKIDFDLTFIKKQIIELRAEFISIKKAEGHLTAPEPKQSLELEYEGRTYGCFIPCKYKCGWLSSWAEDYKKGDRKLHYNPVTGEISEECPKYKGGT